MPQKKTVHILSHTHWDREWYLDSKYTNAWLLPFFENLFAMLEREKKYKFILDGQMSMIDDWFEQLALKQLSIAEAKSKIRKYVGQGRLIIGPYYLQPDWQLVSAESLVRNMLQGRKMADELGGSTCVGWLLDNFGQISQTAQLHREANLEGLFVWRGIYMEPEKITTEFLWESPDGTKIPAVYMVNSYRNAMRLAAKPEIFEKRIADEVEKMQPFNLTSNVLLMNGYDQDIEPDDVMSLLKNRKSEESYTIVQSSPLEYLNAVLAEKPELPTVKGAQYTGRYISVFPGVMSARIYLKQQNAELQYLLERVLEPLSVMNMLSGGEYEASFLESLWKLLLKNHPHDSICGVSIDAVHTDMEYRYKTIRRLAYERLENLLAQLSAKIDTRGEGEAILIFNTSVRKRRAVVNVDTKNYLVENIPGLGWAQLDKKSKASYTVTVKDFTASNALLSVKINPNGSFNVTHIASGRVFKNQGIFEDRADAGDLYNYSWPRNDTIISSAEQKAKISIVQNDGVVAEFRIEIIMEVPQMLEENRDARTKVTIKLPIVSFVKLEAGANEVQVRTELKNTAKDHVLRVLFPSDLKVHSSFGGSPFDVTERALNSGDFDESSLPEHVKAVIIGAREPYGNTFFQGQQIATVSDTKHGLAIFNKGLQEYEVRPEHSTIAVTLFRSVSYIASEIHSRLGDAGPHMLTPEGQCLRNFVFEYAVCPYNGTIEEARIAEQADNFNHPLIALSTVTHSGELKNKFSFIEQGSGYSLVSAIKKAEVGNKVVLRFYNPTEQVTQDSFLLSAKARTVTQANILEREQKIVAKDTTQVTHSSTQKKIVTLVLDLPAMAVPEHASYPITILDNARQEDFSQYPSLELVSKEELAAELHRAETLGEKSDDVLFRRPALEARVSAILAHAQFQEQEIPRLGLALNDARVQRRLYDYTAQYSSEEDKASDKAK